MIRRMSVRMGRLAPPLLIAALLVEIENCGSRETASSKRAAAAEDSLPRVMSVSAAAIPALVHGSNVTLVNAWATWCDPCREEFPALLAAARSRAPDGVRLVLISTDFPDQLEAVRGFLTAHGVTDTSYLKSGDDMSFINALSPKWSGALPATFVFDARGKLIEFWEGRSDSSRFAAALTRALAARSSAKESVP